MKRLSLLTIGSMLLALPAAAQLERGTDSSGSSAFSAPRGGAMVLFDQTDNEALNGAPDQDFETGYDTYDSEGADDFEVDFVDGWDVTQVNTVGTTGTPGGATVNVNFYTDNGGTPLGGNNVCSYSGVAPTVDNLGSFEIELPTTCELDPGVHWLAIQTDQNFASFGQHFWSNRTTQTGNPGHWRNPGDGFSSGCTDWDEMTNCGVGGGTNPDFLFQIVGTLGQPDTPVIEVPTVGQWGLLSLIAALAIGGIFVVRRLV